MTPDRIKTLQNRIKIISNEISDIYYKEQIFQQRTKPSFLINADGHVVNSVTANHYSAVLSAIRRQLGQRDDEISLVNVLRTLESHSEEVTETWYVAEWLQDSELIATSTDEFVKEFVKTIPYGEFQEYFGKQGFLDRRWVSEDIELLFENTRKIRSFVNKTIAHTGMTKPESIDEADYTLALETLNNLAKKYVLLLTQVGLELKPVIQD
ncbi:MAG: hypothetical protein ACD_22C00047G0015 [uncultured bacterium]|nr:MAG: hypothetical protein ACD_22C00047G0015 [uncultured bacterium]